MMTVGFVLLAALVAGGGAWFHRRLRRLEEQVNEVNHWIVHTEIAKRNDHKDHR